MVHNLTKINTNYYKKNLKLTKYKLYSIKKIIFLISLGLYTSFFTCINVAYQNVQLIKYFI
jgi:hypothetical protein